MRIGIDASWAAGQRTGTGNYTLNLVRGLLEVDSKNEYILYFSKKCPGSNPLFSLEAGNVVKKVVTDAFLTNLRQQVNIPFSLIRDEIDIYHSTGYFLPFLWPGKKIVTIYDMNFALLKHHWWRPDTRLSYLSLRIQTVLVARTASKIVTTSLNSKKDIMKVLRVPGEKIAVTYLGCDPFYSKVPSAVEMDQVRARYDLDQFFLFVSILSPQKNLEGVLRGFSRLRAAIATKCKLVVVGKEEGSYCREVVVPLIHHLGLADHVVLTGFIGEIELRALYYAALGLVFPSFGEGFGLPILEAMTCGTPVITSGISSMPEVAGDAAIFVDPHDAVEIGYAMQRLLTDDLLRETMAERGRVQANRFSWKITAQKTVDIYERVHNALPATK